MKRGSTGLNPNESAGRRPDMALMDKDDVKRAVYILSAVSIMLVIALVLLIETGVIFNDAK
jgi:hypothetical protein